MKRPNWFLQRTHVLAVIGCAFFALMGFRYFTPASSLPLPDVDKHGVFTISDNVNLVLLDVSVKGRNGGYIAGLQKTNFRVFEDGRRREITQFASIDTPVTVGLVVDNSGSMRAKKPEVTMAGLSFARQSNSQDEFFVVNFNNSVVRGLPPDVMFTDKLQDLRAALFYGQPAGKTALYDAIAYSLRHLEYAHQAKRTLIVVSDGADNASTTTLKELMKMIEASRTSIYTVGLYDPEDPDVNRGVMSRIATVSGGEFFEPAKLEDVLPVFDKIAKDIRNTYTIGYVPDEANHRLVHTVKVMAEENSHRLTVHTRTAYITTPLSELLARQQQKQNDSEARQ